MPSIGEILRVARTQKGISEEAVSKILKIKVERVKDLEEDRFEHFAAAVYVRSFIRHYATYLGLDAVNLVQQYEQEHPEPERKPIFDAKEETRTQTFIRHQPPAKAQGLALTATGQTVLVAVLVFILIGAGALWIILRITPTPSQPPSPPESQSSGSPFTSSLGGPLIPHPTSTNVNTHLNESWNITSPTHLDSSLTFGTNAAPTSLPGQPALVP